MLIESGETCEWAENRKYPNLEPSEEQRRFSAEAKIRKVIFEDSEYSSEDHKGFMPLVSYQLGELEKVQVLLAPGDRSSISHFLGRLGRLPVVLDPEKKSFRSQEDTPLDSCAEIP